MAGERIGPERASRALKSNAASSGIPAAAAAAARRFVELLEHVTQQIERDERQLRGVLRRRIEAGEFQNALTVLADWDELAAGDVLRRHMDEHATGS